VISCPGVPGESSRPRPSIGGAEPMLTPILVDVVYIATVAAEHWLTEHGYR
jgi:hypothetical protein